MPDRGGCNGGTRFPAGTDNPTLADLATNPGLAAEVDLDHIPELLGEMEQLRAILGARLALRISRPAPTEDRLLVITEAAARLGGPQGLAPSRTPKFSQAEVQRRVIQRASD